MKYILSAGFGFPNNYFANLIPFLNGEILFLDDCKTKFYENEVIIGIGHSLGFLKLNNSGINFDILIGLQGFIDFCGNNEKRKNNINSMMKLCAKNPNKFLEFFYKTCGYNEKISTNLNSQKLINDLELMKLKYNHCGKKTLIIGSEDDQIVPPEIIENNFQKIDNVKIQYVDDGKHALGYRKSNEISKIITHSINEVL